MKKANIIALTLFLVGAGSPGSAAEAEELSQNDWLLRAENDNARFRLLQQQMRGFDQPMWEVGERFERLHDALQRENYELAVYHWDKIKTTIENGVAREAKVREDCSSAIPGRKFARPSPRATSVRPGTDSTAPERLASPVTKRKN